ncbi:MAG: T9SS type A sorting domain-containing protein [Bacteroidales bacterium]|nr:T9SS type A sorting domain-containing protein [Bacteroidales bacterium]
MKRILLLTITAIAFQLALTAQNFVSPGKQWSVLSSGMPLSYSTEIFWIEGDSVVNDMAYQKIWISMDSLQTRHYRGLLREDSNVVYYIQPGNSEGILYDFNLEIGDTISILNYFCFDPFPLTVYEIDTVEYFGMMRKRWHLGIQGEPQEVWIEGIGSHSGPIYSGYEFCIVCPFWELLCFHDQGELQYIAPHETECYKTSVGQSENFETSALLIKPNPVKIGSTLFVDSPHKLETISLFNTSGQMLQKIEPTVNGQTAFETNELKPGLYFVTAIVNGQHITRKIIVE